MKGVKPPATSPFSQFQLRFNEDSLSDKKSEVGLNYFYTGGLLGAIGAAVLIPQWRPILVVNTDMAIQYVALNSMAANTLLAAPTVDEVFTVNGTVQGVVTVGSIVGFNVGDLVTVSDDNSIPQDGYITALANGVWETGRLTALAADGATFIDGDTFILDDGLNPATTFEFWDGVGAPPANPIQFAGGETAIQMAAVIITAINNVGAGLAITATTGGGALVNLVSDAATAFNLPIVEVLTAGSLTPIGMAGGIIAGGGSFGMRIRTLLALGADMDLSIYTLVDNAHVLLAGTYGAVRRSGIGIYTTSAPHGYLVNQSVLVAGVGDVSFNGTFLITAVPSPNVFHAIQALTNAYSGGGTTAVGAPAGAFSGIPILPNGRYIVLSSGPNTQIIASSANVFAYVANDNVVDVPESGLHG